MRPAQLGYQNGLGGSGGKEVKKQRGLGLNPLVGFQVIIEGDTIGLQIKNCASIVSYKERLIVFLCLFGKVQ
jgi:hypothetical protein